MTEKLCACPRRDPYECVRVRYNRPSRLDDLFREEDADDECECSCHDAAAEEDREREDEERAAWDEHRGFEIGGEG